MGLCVSFVWSQLAPFIAGNPTGMNDQLGLQPGVKVQASRTIFARGSVVVVILTVV